MSTDLAAGRSRMRTRAVPTDPETLYEPAPWLIVRSPLLPSLGPGSISTTRPRDGLADPRVRRALAIGSPDLLDALQRPEASARDQARAKSKLARYLIRMSTRPTPYGAFAAVSLAEWGERTTLTLLNDRDRIRTRPDMGWLVGLCLALDTDAVARTESLWMVNACAVERHGRLGLADTAKPQGSVRITAAVREVLRLARHPVPYGQLRDHLLESTTGSPEQVDRLLNQLWEQRLLVTDLRPRLTTANPAVDLRQRLSARGSCAKSARALEELLADMSSFDSAPASEAPSRLRGIAARANALHPVSGPVVQSDMARPVGDGGQVNAWVGKECAHAAELLLRLSPEPLGSPDLHTYRRRFLAHYGQQEIPLLDMLDEHTGIGPLGHAHASNADISPERAAMRARTLVDLALAAIRERERVVELTDAMVTSLQTWDPSPATAPISLDLSAFVVATSAQAIDQGNFHVVVGPNLGASSAGRSLGRFADLLAPEGVAALQQLSAAEHRARPDAGLPVEVVYLPENHRSANVIVRPVAHDREIVLDTPSGLPTDRVVPLGDIAVGVRHDRFYLRSRNLGVELRPTARHMLNTHRAPAVCQFLDVVSRDGSPQFAPFDWGSAAGFPFLPRVQYGRIVLAPARWLLRPAIDGHDGWIDDASAFARHLAEWRTAWSVPARVYLTMSDNRLLLDLEAPDQVEQLRTEARSARAQALVLQEALPDTTDAWLPGRDGRFLSEIVVPLVLRASPSGAEPRPITAPVRPTNFEQKITFPDRVRLPGSDWLFAKFYCDRDQENHLLTGPLRQLCEMIETSGLAQQWFFLRYADPDPHLRVRWKGDPEILIRHLLPEITRFTANLTEDGMVSRLVIDTYDRELARYGGVEGTDVSEEIFSADSRAVMRLLARESDLSVSGDLTELLAVTTDDLLAGLNLSTEDRLRWYSQQAEMVADEVVRRQAGKDYRTRQKRLRVLLRNSDGPALLGEDVAEILRQRRHTLARAATQLTEIEANGRLVTSRDALWSSYVHLHCNRLLGGRAPSEGHLLQLLQRTRKGLSVAPA
jgi:thiopeptide-type bacteriocin biosynthesis protein